MIISRRSLAFGGMSKIRAHLPILIINFLLIIAKCKLIDSANEGKVGDKLFSSEYLIPQYKYSLF